MDNNFRREYLSVSGLTKFGSGMESANSFPKVPGYSEPMVMQDERYNLPWGANGQMPYGRVPYGKMPYGKMYHGQMAPGYREKFQPGRPFYMNPPQLGNEKGLLEDLDYLKRMYPDVVHRYMEQISDMLDKLDYEGSMIYDEYPDCYQLKRLSRTVVDMIRRKEMEQGRSKDGDALPTGGKNPLTPEELVGTGDTEDKWLWVEYLVRILVSLEVYRRRNRKTRRYY